MDKETPQEEQDEQVVTKKLSASDVVTDYNNSWRYIMSTYYNRWKDAWMLTNNMRVNRGYEGVADTFIPLLFSLIETSKANIIGGRPKFSWMPTSDEQTSEIPILNGVTSYVWEKGRFQATATDWVDGALTYGSGIMHVTWDTEIDIPVSRYINIKDFWIDPAASSIEHAERDQLACGYRYLTTIESLKARKMVNPDFDDSKPERKNNQRYVNYYDPAALDEAGEFSPQQTDQKDKNMWQGSTLGDDAETKQCEVIVEYRGDKKYEVVNRKALIYAGDSELDDMYPFAPLYCFKDASLFYGRGYPDILKKRQEDLNDVDNQDTDNMSYQIDSVKWVDPAYSYLIPQIVSGPGVVIPIPGDKIGEMQKPAYNPKAHEKREEIKQDMREAVGAGEIFQGMPTEQNKSATEINAMQMNAGKRFDLMIQEMENGGFQRAAKLIHKFLQKYADDEMIFRVVGAKGVEFKKYIKEQYQGDYDPSVQLDASAKTEQARAAQQLQNMYAQYAQNPFINLLELTKMDMQKQYGLDEMETTRLLSNPGQPGPTEPGDQPADGSVASPEMPSGAPAPGANPLAAPPVTAPEAPQGPPTDDMGLTPADYIKLYQAAATAGDTSTMDQAVQRLGLTPPEGVPVAIAQKHAQTQDTKIKSAMSIQKQQHDMEHAALDKTMALQSHQKQMEAPADAGTR